MNVVAAQVEHLINSPACQDESQTYIVCHIFLELNPGPTFFCAGGLFPFSGHIFRLQHFCAIEMAYVAEGRLLRLRPLWDRHLPAAGGNISHLTYKEIWQKAKSGRVGWFNRELLGGCLCRHLALTTWPFLTKKSSIPKRLKHLVC